MASALNSSAKRRRAFHVPQRPGRMDAWCGRSVAMVNACESGQNLEARVAKPGKTSAKPQRDKPSPHAISLSRSRGHGPHMTSIASSCSCSHHGSCESTSPLCQKLRCGVDSLPHHFQPLASRYSSAATSHAYSRTLHCSVLSFQDYFLLVCTLPVHLDTANCAEQHTSLVSSPSTPTTPH